MWESIWAAAHVWLPGYRFMVESAFRPENWDRLQLSLNSIRCFDDSLIICPLPRVKVAAAKWQKRRPYLQPIRAGGNCCHSIVADKNNDPIGLFASLHTPRFFLLLLRLLPWRKIALGPKHWGAIEVLGLKLWIAYNNDMSSRFAFWNKYIEK